MVVRVASATAVRVLLLAVIVVWAVTSADPERRLACLALAGAEATVLGLSSRRSALALAAAFAGFAGLMLSESVAGQGAEDAFLALLVVGCFLAGRYASPMHQPWVAAVVLALLSANLLQPGRDPVAADAVFPVVLTAGPWLLGLAVQLAARRERVAVGQVELLEAIGAGEVRRAAAEERLRIAREVHDQVAHDISAVSLQAQVARRQVEAGAVVDAVALRAIEETARLAMDDVRRLLGVLRDPAEAGPASPSPGLEAVGELVDTARALGQQVEHAEEGTDRRLAPALSQAAYRIVQEALTNARRHGAGPTRLHLRWTPETLELTVTNPTTGAVPGPRGHGVSGIEERAALFGGRADAGPTEDGWRVQVTLPAPSSPGATS